VSGVSGLFVTLEGGEGSGKSTQIQRLAGRIRALGIEPVLAREPGGTPLAEGVRALLLDADRRPGALAEVFLLEAARAQLVSTVLRPALEAGRVVLCDRYDDSTLAYQGGGRGLDDEMLRTLNRAATGGLRPDLTLLLDAPHELGLERRSRQGSMNRLDREPAEFHARVRQRYLELAAAEPGRFVVVDATQPEDRIETAIWAELEPRLQRASVRTGP
jgi:dTMP kinase